MKIDELLLITGNDVPFPQAKLAIHQPTLKEIGMIQELNFLTGVQFLLFDKNNLTVQDKFDLSNQSNFNIFMMVMNSKDKAKHKVAALMVLSLLFPTAKIKLKKDKIVFQINEFETDINENNFLDFQDIVAQIFCLSEEREKDFNPADNLAKGIAEKIKKARQKKAKMKGEDVDKLTVYSKFISILAVGLKKSIIDLSNYTIYQIRDEFKRFQLKQDFDIYLKAKLAGAQDLEEVENWMEDIHP